ncbi:hypothetical protein ACGFZK_13755 [Streptomyces sp. NPDC048257]|uniref:hypothetical protein n=1 Tax=Streptomyces sp. NPDC048257 TaxID=3365526 RepID=UPI0037172B6B
MARTQTRRLVLLAAATALATAGVSLSAAAFADPVVPRPDGSGPILVRTDRPSIPPWEVTYLHAGRYGV